MTEKKSLEEIIESIFLLVNEAKEQSLKIEAKNYYSTSNINNQNIKPIEEKIDSSENKKWVKFKNADSEINKNLKKITTKNSDWSNIKFSNLTHNDIVKKSPKKTLMDKVKIKSEEKFKIEIEKWSEKKLNKLVEKEVRSYTNSLLEQKIKKL
tara:strand:- start:82 stop:540 length:459 start_codon:yes stop_codon:yes gene_type:complete